MASPLPNVGYWAELAIARSQSSSRSGGRLTNVVEFADPVWTANVATAPVYEPDFRTVEAWRDGLRGSLRPVLYRHPGYSAPRAHSRAPGPEKVVGSLASITNGNVCVVNGVSPDLVLQPGDFVSFSAAPGKALGRVVGCEGSGTSRTIIVEPALPRGYPTGGRVRFDRAELTMRMVPNSWGKQRVQDLAWRGSFELIESMTPRGALAVEVSYHPPTRQGEGYVGPAPVVLEGEEPFAFSIASGALPEGLTLNATTGVVSGTPVRNGTFSWTLRVVDADGRAANAPPRTLTVRPPALLSSSGVVLDPTYARGGAASFFGLDGVMRQAAANEPRWDHDPVTRAVRGYLHELAGQNISRNPRAEGATVGAIGSGGAHPTGWNVSGSANGITATVVGTGVEDGIPYEEVRFNGTATANTAIVLGGGTGTGAAQGETWTSSFHARVVAGTLNGLTGILHWLWESPSNANGSGTIALDSRLLREARHTLTRTLPTANTNAIFHQLRANVANGQTVDVTFRFGLPQLERSPVATSVILPPAGTIAASNRAVDAASIAVGDWYDRTALTIIAEIDVPQRTGLGNRGIFAVDAGNTLANRVIVYFDDAGALNTRIVGPSNTPAQVAPVAIPAGTPSRMKIGLTCAVGRAALAWNGNLVAHPAPAEMPQGALALRIANGQGGTIPLPCHVRSVRHFPRVMSDAEFMEAMAA